MEKKKVIFLVTILVVLLVISITSWYGKFFILGMKEIDFSLKVGDTIGLNVDVDQLYFGTVPPGGTSSRSVFIQNEEYPSARAYIKAYGEKKGWLSVSKNTFLLKKGEGENVEFKMEVPTNAEHGEYAGRVLVIFTRF